MSTVTLSDVADLIRGVTFKPTDVDSSGVGVMRTKNVQADLDLSDILRVPAQLVKRPEQYLRHGDTLISSANSWNAVGRACWVPELTEPLAIGGFVTALRPQPGKVDARFLYRWFTSPRVQATLRSFGNQTTNISNLNLKRTAAMPVPLPPLPEQRRIAAILDHADALRATRRQVLTHLDALTQSIFNDMFIEITERAALKDLGIDFVSGKSVLGDDADAHPVNRVIKVSAISSGVFVASETKPMPRAYEPPPAHRLRNGDILFGRASGSLDLLGATAVVDIDPVDLFLPDKVWRLTTTTDGPVLPGYVLAVLRSSEARGFIRHNASGAAGVRNIGKSKLLAYAAPVPPLSLQHEFAARLDTINQQRAAVQHAHTASDNLFSSLQSRAFRGEL